MHHKSYTSIYECIFTRNIDTEDDSHACIHFDAIKIECIPDMNVLFTQSKTNQQNAAGRSRNTLIERN